ncbi:hypothetical protein DMR_32480 [Solidesulfovibrio magneticus RS-1]|uniref:Uncharacterized protein n=1 Tax=Solidesulfovibrio magneticus (strain ATCC 700980 / DSM 13731 / RS-1) TaxID=573370 RepID=C4XJI9_SOLM1|nr:hypothetical protein DMR_32480 [Solidesulfovibrio magneticus RS-1]
MCSVCPQGRHSFQEDRQPIKATKRLDAVPACFPWLVPAWLSGNHFCHGELSA